MTNNRQPKPPSEHTPDSPPNTQQNWVMFSLNSIESKLDSLKTEMNNQSDELKKRIRSLERIMYLAIGGLIVIAALAGFAYDFLSSNFDLNIVFTGNETEINSGGG